MFAYQLTVDDLIVMVSLKSDHPDKYAEIQIKGKAEAVEQIRKWLRRQSGFFGHTIDARRTTPIDLYAVMQKNPAKQFKPKLTEGAEIIKNYKSPIREGSLS